MVVCPACTVLTHFLTHIPLSTTDIAWCLCGDVDEVMCSEDTSIILMTNLSEIYQVIIINRLYLSTHLLDCGISYSPSTCDHTLHNRDHFGW